MKAGFSVSLTGFTCLESGREQDLYLTSTDGFDFWSAVARQRRVLLALMLRNIRTRYFGHGLGYLIAIAWPLSHILIIVEMYSILGRASPYGSSTALFIATGTVPFMIVSYISRFMMIAVVQTRPLLAFPRVKILDVLLASAALEVLSATCVTVAIVIVAWFCGVDVMPLDIVQAAYAFGASILLGVGFGLFNGVIALAFPMWITVFFLSTLVLWATSGVVFVPDALPKSLREMLAYHPILQLVEWMRAAYFEGYGSLVLDRTYALGVGLGALFLGLLFERAMRGYLLAAR